MSKSVWLLVQILTIEDLFAGKRVAYPGAQLNATFKRAPFAKGPRPRQLDMFKPSVTKATAKSAARQKRMGDEE
jgi:hypothetical protein